MSYSSTAESDFSILVNGVDSELEIIQHNCTGFYNITKTAKLIGKLMAEYPDRYSSTMNKCNRACDWFKTDTAKDLINSCKQTMGVEMMRYDLGKGTPKKFAGIYVHESLYDFFLVWLDIGYAMRIISILKQIRKNANMKLIQEKDCKIEELKQSLAEFRKESRARDKEAKARDAEAKAIAEEQNAKISQLLSFGNKIVSQNDKLQLTMDMTREELSESLDYLVDKSYHSTIDPSDPSKVTHFAILAPDHDNRSGKTILVRGQVKYIHRTIARYEATHTPVVNCTYNANAINLINNAREKYDQMVRKYINVYNVPIREANEKLKLEIKAHNTIVARMSRANRPTTMIKRYFLQEKQSLLTLSDIPISFKSTHIWYEPNTHIDYGKVLGCIIEMNDETQKSPLDPYANTATDDSSSSDED